MFVLKPEEVCPYADKCSGYVGGVMCSNGNHVKCDRFKLLQQADDCYEEMDKLLRGLNGKNENNH